MSRRVGTGVATVNGTPITFSQPIVGNYEIFFFPGSGVDYVNPVNGNDTRTTTGFTAFSLEDGTIFSFLAENDQ